MSKKKCSKLCRYHQKHGNVAYCEKAGWSKGQGKYVCIYFPPEMKFESINNAELMYKVVDYMSMDFSFIISKLKKHEKELKDNAERSMKSLF
jgi:hypothetical protein